MSNMSNQKKKSRKFQPGARITFTQLSIELENLVQTTPKLRPKKSELVREFFFSKNLNPKPPRTWPNQPLFFFWHFWHLSSVPFRSKIVGLISGHNSENEKFASSGL